MILCQSATPCPGDRMTRAGNAFAGSRCLVPPSAGARNHGSSCHHWAGRPNRGDVPDVEPRPQMALGALTILFRVPEKTSLSVQEAGAVYFDLDILKQRTEVLLKPACRPTCHPEST